MNIPKKILLAALILVNTSMVFSQDDKQKQILEWITSKQYTFVAESALPLGARTRQLTSLYDLTIKPDSVISDLPYFGQAFTAPIGNEDNGFHFTATNFDYDSKKNKNGGWDIIIKIKQSMEARQLTLFISQNGYGTLQITSTNRQPISYNGYIKSGRM